MIKFLILLALAMICLQHTQKNWIVSENMRIFSKFAKSRQPVIAFIYDSKNCPLCKVFVERRIAKIINEPKMKKFDLVWTYYDYSNDQRAKSNFNLTEKIHIRYYRHKKYVDLSNAVELIKLANNNRFDYPKTLDTIHDFIKTLSDSFSTEITDISMINDKLNNNEAVVVYLGQNNTNFRQFYGFASKNEEFNVFHSFNPEISREVKLIAEISPHIDTDIFLIVRPPSMKYHTKESKSTFFRFPLSISHMQRKCEFEIYPKLRDPTYTETSINMLKAKRHTIILYSRSDPYSFVNWLNFKKIVQAIPKQFILTFTSPKQSEHQHYQSLFESLEVPLEEEQIYIIHRLGKNSMYIDKYGGEFNVEKFLQFMAEFIEERTIYLQTSTEGDLVNKIMRSLNKLKDANEFTDEL